MTTAPDSISVKLFAGLELATTERCATRVFEPREAPTVGALARRLGLERGALGLVLVNGLHAGADRELRGGDEVSLFPPLGGG